MSSNQLSDIERCLKESVAMSNFAKSVLVVLINVLRTLLDDGGDMKLSQLVNQLDDIVEADGRPYGAGHSCVLLGLPGEIDGVEAVVSPAKEEYLLDWADVDAAEQERRLMLRGLQLLQAEQKGQRRAHQCNSWPFRDLEMERAVTGELVRRLSDS